MLAYKQIVILDSEVCCDSFRNFQFLCIFQYKAVISTITHNISIKKRHKTKDFKLGTFFTRVKLSFETRRSHIIQTRPDLSYHVNVSCPLISAHVITVKDACCDWFKCNQIKLIKVQQGRWMKQLCTKSIIATSLLVPTAVGHQSDIF